MPQTHSLPERRENHALRALFTEYAKTEGMAERFASQADAILFRTRRAAQRIQLLMQSSEGETRTGDEG